MYAYKLGCIEGRLDIFLYEKLFFQDPYVNLVEFGIELGEWLQKIYNGSHENMQFETIDHDESIIDFFYEGKEEEKNSKMKGNRISDYISALNYFNDAPQEINLLAFNETLQYLLDDVYGKTVPVITTAFWGNSNGTYSQDNFEVFIENGGFIIQSQASDISTAISHWQEQYEMSETQITLLHSVLRRKIKNPTGNILLTRREIQMIEADDEEGLSESRISFGELGIRWEE